MKTKQLINTDDEFREWCRWNMGITGKEVLGLLSVAAWVRQTDLGKQFVKELHEEVKDE